MKKNILVFLFMPLIGFSQGKLDVAKEVLASKSSSSSRTSSHSNENRSDDENISENEWVELCIELFVYAGKTALGNFDDRHFSPYPYYYDNVYGEYDFGLEKGDKKYLARGGINYLLGNSINSIEANVSYRFHPLIGVELSHHHFFEEFRNINSQLNITSLMLNYYRVRERSFTGWWGMGLTYVGNEVNTSGFAYNIGLEIYPFKPLSFHLSFKQSFINQSNINTFKFQTKYHKKNMAFFTGYHDISIATVKVSGVILGFQISL